MPPGFCRGVAAISTSAKHRVLIHAIAVVAVLWASAADARKYPWDTEDDIRGHFDETKPWVEQQAAIPAYPDPANLIEVPVQIPDSNLKMYIDASTLAIGTDGVVRYALVLRSPSGAENVFYEGIRCATHELRSYAYGSSQSRWEPIDSVWGPLNDLGVMRYRERLYKYYFCRPPMDTLPRREMLQRMRYGVPRELMK